MLATCILHHVEIKGTILDTVTELEDLELTLGCSVIFFSKVSEDMVHILNSVLSSHLLWYLSPLQLAHHGIHSWHLLQGKTWIETTHLSQLLQSLDLPS